MPTRSTLITSLIVAAIIQTAIVIIPVIPLGISGEWEWSRHALLGPPLSLLSQFAPSIVGFSVLLFVARLGDARLHRHHMRCVGDQPRQRRGPARAITALLLLALVTASWIWLLTAQRCTPAPHRNLKSLWVLYDPSASGYFHEAVFEMESVGAFLSGYPERMAEGEVYHVGTHPPGLFLLSRVMVDLCRSSPGTATRLQKLLPRMDLQAFRSLETSARLNRPLSEPELTALGLLSELTSLAAALTVVPLYFLTRRCFTALIAWRTACLWPTIPCLAVFLPKSDVLFTLTSMSALALVVLAMASAERMRWRFIMAATGGFILWCGLMMSLAHLPVLVLLTVVCGIRLYHLRPADHADADTSKRQMKECVQVLAMTVGTILAATVLFSLAARCNMFSVWRMNLNNHAAFYDQHTRTAWKWLLVNPLELGMALGLPLAVATVFGFRRSVQRLRQTSGPNSGTLATDVILAVAVTIGLLWLSCRNSGEAARLWCFMTPWLTLPAAFILRAEVRSDRVKNNALAWHTLLILQMLVSMITTGRVNGFSV